MRKVVLIKLGGSIITEKDTPMTARQDVITQLAAEIAAFYKENPDIQIILGNGAGSFGHYQVQQYNLKEGMNSSEQIYGYCIVQDAVAQLNRLIIKSILAEKVPVCTIQPSSILISENNKKKEIFTASITEMIRKRIIPVVYGDIILDTNQGCTIFSTEDLFDLLIQANIGVTTVIHVTGVDGVLDRNQKVISTINEDTWNEVQQNIYAPKGFDITGGMKHKIETALEYAKKGVNTFILNGENKGCLKTVQKDSFNGTLITAQQSAV